MIDYSQDLRPSLPRRRGGIVTPVLLGVTLATLAAAPAPGKTQNIRFEPYSYEQEGVRIDAELGRLAVPQRHAEIGGPMIELAFIRLKATTPNPGPPIIYLAGGPGGSGIALSKGPRGRSFQRLREVGDVIALDQRGTGQSRPNLDCPGIIDLPLPTSRSDALARLSEASRACALHWRAHGVDLSAYNVVESARDIDALRRALRVEKIVLWGSSYGTQLGVATIRHHGDNIAKAVFAGMEGPDHTLKLPRIVDRQLEALDGIIASSTYSRIARPPLRMLAARVLAAADRQPYAVFVAAKDRADPLIVQLGRFELERAIAGSIGTRAGLALLPAMLGAFDRRDLTSPLIQGVAQQIAGLARRPLGSAMAFATDCSSSASPGRLRQIAQEAEGALIADPDFPLPAICPAWDVPALPDAERMPIRSTLPVLFISGTLDGQTPPQNAEEVMRGFPNSRHVLIEGAGHGHDLFVSSPQIDELTLNFIRSGAVGTDRIRLPPLILAR